MREILGVHDDPESVFTFSRIRISGCPYLIKSSFYTKNFQEINIFMSTSALNAKLFRENAPSLLIKRVAVYKTLKSLDSNNHLVQYCEIC